MIYLSGPMSGLPEYNYPAFRKATANLRKQGFIICSPHEWGVVEGWTWEQYMRRALMWMMQCDSITMLPGWETSRGALLELQVATALNWPVQYYLGI